MLPDTLASKEKLKACFFRATKFDCNLSMSKCLLTVNWAELGIKTVDTLTYTVNGVIDIPCQQCGHFKNKVLPFLIIIGSHDSPTFKLYTL